MPVLLLAAASFLFFLFVVVLLCIANTLESRTLRRKRILYVQTTAPESMRRARHVEASYAVSGIVGGATRLLCMGLQPPNPVVECPRIVLCVGNPDIVTTPSSQYSSPFLWRGHQACEICPLPRRRDEHRYDKHR